MICKYLLFWSSNPFVGWLKYVVFGSVHWQASRWKDLRQHFRCYSYSWSSDHIKVLDFGQLCKNVSSYVLVWCIMMLFLHSHQVYCIFHNIDGRGRNTTQTYKQLSNMLKMPRKKLWDFKNVGNKWIIASDISIRIFTGVYSWIASPKEVFYWII